MPLLSSLPAASAIPVPKLHFSLMQEHFFVLDGPGAGKTCLYNVLLAAVAFRGGDASLHLLWPGSKQPAWLQDSSQPVKNTPEQGRYVQVSVSGQRFPDVAAAPLI